MVTTVVTVFPDPEMPETESDLTRLRKLSPGLLGHRTHRESLGELRELGRDGLLHLAAH